MGVHLVLATQRPDSKAVDPQVKTNLIGICCFQMPNNVSSMTVLDSGKAAQLPDIPGRAIWKTGGSIKVIQTPHLSIERAREILSPMKERSVGRRSWSRRNLRSYDLEV